MHKKIKIYCLGLVTALFLVAVTGCHQSNPGPRPSTLDPRPTVARLHWLGKKRLAAESNATNFMALWHLPESAKLEAQTLDKLSTAPWRLLSTATPLSNAPTALLRPLLDDLVSEESYLEVRAATNQPGAFVLALRLDAVRAALWRTNLAAVLESLTGNKPVAADSGWTLGTPHSALRTPHFTLTRSGDWTLLSFSRPSTLDPRPSDLLADVTARIQRDHAPFAAPTTNYWLETDLDLRALGLPPSAFRLPLSPSALENLPHLTLTVIGDGQNVRTRGELNFPKPLDLQLEPWNIPTNLIHDPLIAFSSARGLAPWVGWLQKMSPFAPLQPPDQVFTWAVAGYPLQTYFAMPQPDSTNFIRSLSAGLTERMSAPAYRNFPGRFVTETNFARLTMEGAPFMAPRLETVYGSSGEFALGGLIPMMRTNRPLPGELLTQLFANPNLIYYDWELTGPRVEAWLYIGQTLRLLFNRAQLPADSFGLKWLQALLPRVGNSATAVTAASATTLSFTRNSTIGFTGLELHLLADWLESPNFPAGLHTSLAATKRKPGAVPAGPPAAPMKP